MSVNFYTNLDKETLVCKLTLPSVTHYAENHGIEHSDIGNNVIFKMTWKRFVDMVHAGISPKHRFSEVRFMEIENTPAHTASLNIPLQDRPFLFTQKSGINLITPDALPANDDIEVTLIFTEKRMEHFDIDGTGYGWIEYLLLIVVIIIIGYLIYAHYYQTEKLE